MCIEVDGQKLDDTGRLKILREIEEESKFVPSQFERGSMADVIREVTASMSWQPIVSAPKDGRRILLARFGYWNDPGGTEYGTEEWRKNVWDNSRRVYSLFWVVVGHWSAKWNNWNDGTEPAGLNAPTHFMPLPPLPPEEGK